MPTIRSRDARSILPAVFATVFCLCACMSFAQTPAKMPRAAIVLSAAGEGNLESWKPALRDALARRGWVEGRSIEIAWRLESRTEDVPSVIDSVLEAPVDVLVVGTSVSALHAMKRTSRVPIVVTNAFYPVESGLAMSLSRPGRNVTGRANNAEGIEINGKQLELLKEVAPHVSKVAYLTHPLAVNEDRFAAGGLDASGIPNRTVAAGRAVGITLVRVEVGDRHPVDAAVAKALRQGANGLMVDIGRDLRQVAQLAAKHKLPSVYTYESGIASGGLLYYGPTISEIARQTASFVDRILRGAKPSELPFESPSRMQLLINAKAATAIGLTVPRHILMQADRVIE